MKLKTTAGELHNALKDTAAHTKNSPNLPILECVLLSAPDGCLTVTAANGDAQLRASTDIAVEDTAPVAVPARKLLSIIRSLPADAPVSLAETEQRFTVQSGRSRFQLSKLRGEDFPIFAMESTVQVQLPAESLAALFRAVLPAMPTSDVRYYLNSVRLELWPDCLVAVATDGHRLHIMRSKLNTGLQEPIKVLLPAVAATRALKMLEVDGDATLMLGERAARLIVGNHEMISLLLEGQYPSYRQVIPREEPRKAHIQVAPLRGALDRAAALHDKGAPGVRLELAANEVQVSASNGDNEESQDCLDAQYGDEACALGFNASYLRDALTALGGDQVRVGFADAGAATVWRSASNPDALAIIMPMRI